MNKWTIGSLIAVVIAVVVGISAAIAFTGGDDDDAAGAQDDQARCAADAVDCDDPNTVEEGDPALGVCAEPFEEGEEPCEDMVVEDGGDGSMNMCVEGVVDCDDMVVGDPAGGTCLEGTGDCIDTPGIGEADGCGPDNPAGCTDRITEILREDIINRTGVAPDAVVFESVEYTEWPDASLGNPQPDQFYAQVITPGFKVLVVAGGDTYEYHTDLDGNFTLVD